jgi:hypothetical protein
MNNLIFLVSIFMLQLSIVFGQSPADDEAWTENLTKSDEFSGTALNNSK